jgi:septal ring factor EnvC (AmiA/AmiB activator)
MNWDIIKDHLIQSIAAAAMLGGGTMVLTAHTDLARQEVRIERLEKMDGDIHEIRTDMRDTRESVARLEQHMKETK